MLSLQEKYQLLCEKLKGKTFLNEPLSSHTSFKIGGIADLYVEPLDEYDLEILINFCKSQELKYYVLGNGTNVLFSDSGYKGVVIGMTTTFKNIELLDETTIKCGSGIKLSEVCLFALENSLSGFECLWGIPGSVGGAIITNAGAYGGEISDVAIRVNHIDSNGNFGFYEGKDLDFRYRHSVYEDNTAIITSVVFKTVKADKAEIKAKMDELMQRRKDKQPLELPSAGSVFKRPQGAYAAALIEECGLKGCRVGGAQVSEKHTGFIVNNTDATSEDVVNLIEEIKKTVKEKTGYDLECEVRLVD